MAGWALLPLRAFLGFTFLFAGLQKLANPNFFNANSPSGIKAQLIASIRTSPLHAILGHLLSFATPIGVLIALAEVAVGLGTLLGLWVRIAAIGGALLSLTLFLTVSFHSSPYYTGSDIVFLFAWMPLILTGSGGILSLDALIASRVRREMRLGPSTMVPVSFGLVQSICGHYENDRCSAKQGQPCDVLACPFLAPASESIVQRRSPDAVDRRTLVVGGMAAGAVALLGAVTAGAAAGLGRAIGAVKPPPPSTVALNPGNGSSTTTRSPSNTSTSNATGPSSTATKVPAGTAIGSANKVPVGAAATFTDPASGDPALILHRSSGDFVAFDAICPHAGCTVGYSRGADLIVCPCHGSEFDANTGALVQGPATRGLRSITVALGSNGEIYADG